MPPTPMRTLDQIRASRLPANMMQFAARGALSVPPAESIEILVYLARHNKVFGDLARMTLAGWDEKACIAAAADPQTSVVVLDYFISPDNLRPRILPALLENPAVPDDKIAKLAVSATAETIHIMLGSPRVKASRPILEMLRSNPYIKEDDLKQITGIIEGRSHPEQESVPEAESAAQPGPASSDTSTAESGSPQTADEHDPDLHAYLAEHASEIAAEGEKKFQAIGSGLDLNAEARPEHAEEKGAPATAVPALASSGAAAAPAHAPHQAQAHKPHAVEGKRENTLQKISALDVKGRIQLALKGNKEERSILIRDGTKVVALAVLEAPKLTDGEVEKFAGQKNVLEAVLRQIPLKRRFMKNYIVVRNLVANPRTPLDLGLNLMKNLLVVDLKNLSTNKEVSETIRKLALKMYKQKIEEANKK